MVCPVSLWRMTVLMVNRTFRFVGLAIVGAPLLLGGCGLPPAVVAFSYAMDGLSYASSGKSVTDHALSAAAEQDCAMFRMIQGRDICRLDGVGDGTAVLASADGPNVSGGDTHRAPTGAELASANRSQAKSWNIRAGIRADRNVAARAAPPVTAPTDDQIRLINPNQMPVRLAVGSGNVVTARLINFPAATEVFALLQDDGVLEVFTYGTASDNGARTLSLIATYEKYSENPVAFRGVLIGGSFHAIGDLIV